MWLFMCLASDREQEAHHRGRGSDGAYLIGVQRQGNGRQYWFAGAHAAPDLADAVAGDICALERLNQAAIDLLAKSNGNT